MEPQRLYYPFFDLRNELLRSSRGLEALHEIGFTFPDCPACNAGMHLTMRRDRPDGFWKCGNDNCVDWQRRTATVRSPPIGVQYRKLTAVETEAWNYLMVQLKTELGTNALYRCICEHAEWLKRARADLAAASRNNAINSSNNNTNNNTTTNEVSNHQKEVNMSIDRKSVSASSTTVSTVIDKLTHGAKVGAADEAGELMLNLTSAIIGPDAEKLLDTDFKRSLAKVTAAAVVLHISDQFLDASKSASVNAVSGLVLEAAGRDLTQPHMHKIQAILLRLAELGALQGSGSGGTNAGQ